MNATVSIALIVRDEAEMVPGFLESVRGLWDELIVVDTGSTDGTPELFASAGARIFHHQWTDDFAAARNVALEQTTCDWVLVLDADERVSPEFIRAFLSKCDDEAVGALALKISSVMPYGHRREAWVLRAFRRDDEVKYRHAVREDCSSGVARMLARTQRGIERVEAPINHLGYVRTRDAASAKKQRELELLEKRLAAEPNDLYSHLKVLELARFWRDSVLWNEAAKRAVARLDEAGSDAVHGRSWGGELVALIAEGLFRADGEAGLLFLERWEPFLVPGAPFFFRRAQHEEARGDLVAASRDFSRCLGLGELLGDQLLTGVRPRLGLARLALMSGRPREALQHVDEALEVQPRDPEALVAAAALRLQLDGAEHLAAWVAAHELRHGASPEVAWAVGDAALTLGKVASAIAPLRRAAGVPPAGPAALRLAQALLADGQLQAAETLTRSLLKAEPEAGLGVLVFDLLSGQDTELELELTPETASASMRHWVDALLRSGNVEWLTTLQRNSAAVGEAFPWLNDYLRRAS